VIQLGTWPGNPTGRAKCRPFGIEIAIWTLESLEAEGIHAVAPENFGRLQNQEDTVVRENSVRPQNQRDTVRLRNALLLDKFRLGHPKGLLEFLVGYAYANIADHRCGSW